MKLTIHLQYPKYLWLLLSLGMVETAMAQTSKKIVFTYDKNGNEESRKLELLDQNGNTVNQDIKEMVVIGKTIKIQTMPNPTDAYLNVNIIENFDSQNNHTLDIINNYGSVMVSTVLTTFENQIDVRNYSAGTYTVRLTIGSQVRSWNIIKY